MSHATQLGSRDPSDDAINASKIGNNRSLYDRFLHFFGHRERLDASPSPIKTESTPFGAESVQFRP